MSTTISGDTGIDKVQDEAITPTAYVCRIKQLVAQNSTSGTAIDFTGIPSWAKKITVIFKGVSTSGTSSILVQIGSTTFTTTEYISGASRLTTAVNSFSSTAGFIIGTASASESFSGNEIITNITSNVWVSSHNGGQSPIPSSFSGGGYVTLPGVLDRIRITTVNGTDLFDSGMINVMVEG